MRSAAVIYILILLCSVFSIHDSDAEKSGASGTIQSALVPVPAQAWHPATELAEPGQVQTCAVLASLCRLSVPTATGYRDGRCREDPVEMQVLPPFAQLQGNTLSNVCLPMAAVLRQELHACDFGIEPMGSSLWKRAQVTEEKTAQCFTKKCTAPEATEREGSWSESERQRERQKPRTSLAQPSNQRKRTGSLRAAGVTKRISTQAVDPDAPQARSRSRPGSSAVCALAYFLIVSGFDSSAPLGCFQVGNGEAEVGVGQVHQIATSYKLAPICAWRSREMAAICPRFCRGRQESRVGHHASPCRAQAGSLTLAIFASGSSEFQAARQWRGDLGRGVGGPSARNPRRHSDGAREPESAQAEGGCVFGIGGSMEQRKTELGAAPVVKPEPTPPPVPKAMQAFGVPGP